MKLRHAIASNHPVFGNWIKLNDTDTLKPGDQTACASTLLTPEGDQWVDVLPVWKDDIGKTVAEVCDPKQDMDADERVFRRHPLNV